MRAKRSAVAGLVAFIDVPIVHWAVEWWRGNTGGDVRDLHPKISGLMVFSLFSVVAGTRCRTLWLLMHRYRVAVMEDAWKRSGSTWLSRTVNVRARFPRPARPPDDRRRIHRGRIGYVVVGGLGTYALRVVRRGRASAAELPDEDKPWT